jgi:putative heme-binding domain-containing protein
MVQQILRLKDPDLVETVRKVWGNVRTTSEDRLKEAERIRKLIAQPKPEPDGEQGKRLYTKTCGQCHTLFGEGGKIGPELTGSNRRDLNYLLENILDPSAVMAREYQPIIVLTNEGQTITGLLRGENKESIRLQTATEEVTVYREDIEQMKQSELSMMPADLLSPLRDAEIRNLIAYLRSDGSGAAAK